MIREKWLLICLENSEDVQVERSTLISALWLCILGEQMTYIQIRQSCPQIKGVVMDGGLWRRQDSDPGFFTSQVEISCSSFLNLPEAAYGFLYSFSP